MTQSSPIKTDNPLLNLGFEIPFDQIKPEHAESAVDTLIAKSREDLEHIANAPQRQFVGFLQELDTLGQQLGAVSTVVNHLEAVVSSDEWRAANEAILPKVSTFFTELGLHSGLWTAMKAYQASSDAQQLSPEWTRFLTLQVDDFRRNGADLDDAGKQRLTKLNVNLAEVTNQFGKNVMDGIKAYELYVGPERMAGVPQRLQDATAKDAETHGKSGMHRLTLHAPVYGPVVTYADDRTLRQELMQANNVVGVGEGHDNREVLPQILRLRRERAELLGFANFADLVTADRMAGSANAAIKFERDLEERTRPFFDEENQELLAFYNQQAGEGAPEMAAWDVAYWAEKLRQERYDFDEEVLRPYFPMEQVLSGMFEITKRVFGITVKEAQAAGWHKEVKYYDIFNESTDDKSTDNEVGEHIASFYTDWFPRDTKRGGAWMNALYTGGPRENGFAPHLGLMCGNLNPPSGETPSLLSLREVETVFHEFGHLLHHALARVPVQSLSGTQVAWDFVELPSQIMENWVWTPEGLALIAKHYQTGESLPQELYQKMLAARNFRAGAFAMRQYSFASVDLALHVDYDETQGSPLDFTRNLMNHYSFLPLPESNFITQFGHLFSSPVGYAGGYYSYKWAEVLDADAFTRFEQEGVFNRQTGREYVDKLLSCGGSAAPAQLYRDFMGRDPDPEALLRRSGLSKA